MTPAEPALLEVLFTLLMLAFTGAAVVAAWRWAGDDDGVDGDDESTVAEGEEK